MRSSSQKPSLPSLSTMPVPWRFGLSLPMPVPRTFGLSLPIPVPWRFGLSLRWLGLLLVLSPFPAALPVPQSHRYRVRCVQHAQTPLRSSASLSPLQCSALCLRTPSCIKWSRNSTLCQLYPLHSASIPLTESNNSLYQSKLQLYPLHSASNPLTESNNSLYQSKLPEGFSLSADRTVAYRARLFTLLGGREAVISACRQYDPEAAPAVPRTQAQYEAMKALAPAGKWLHVGVREPRGEGEFVDMLTGERVDVPPQWFLYGVVHKSTSSNCMVMLPGGLYTSECNVARHGHICEYRP